LRARIGDLIQVSFRNQVDTKNFPVTLDRGDCDAATGTVAQNGQPIKVNVYPRNNKYPNCVHGSSTSNLHFHGTHTTPATTGDNVLLLIRPALRLKGKDEHGIDYPPIQPTDAVVKESFTKIFANCENTGSPTKWEQLPEKWREKQEELLKLYDKTAPYHGASASLPENLHLWPKNEEAIKAGKWPQYSVGASPYCFRLPDKPTGQKKNDGTFRMGQAPGTHWYHAHVHGSTALNVANGLAGAFIIEGPYDDKLRDFYKNAPGGLVEKVLVIQQLSTSLGLLSAGRSGPPFLSVNGRREPVITMRPGQVQMWRLVNAAYRSFVEFREFKAPTDVVCSSTGPIGIPTPPCVDWRQTAQDGVQFHPDNYEKVGTVNAQFNMAGGNRVDLLVKAPSTPGRYSLTVWESTSESPAAAGAQGTRVRQVTLLTVNVTGETITPPMAFIDKGSFPTFPDFLENLPVVVAPGNKKDVAYDTTPGFPPPPPPEGPPRGPLRGPLAGPDPVLPTHTIDGELFDDEIKQRMALNRIEEWKVVNKAVGIAHPFHIHINPFQVVEVFDPNSEEATKVGGPCYADPTKPETWKPCEAPPVEAQYVRPYVWWDVRAIPAARDVAFVTPEVDCIQGPSAGFAAEYRCPANSGGNVCRLKDGKQKCKLVIPGYFKMRSHFSDFPGVFVQHCHILAHEDVGMMQFVEVYDPRKGITRGTIGLRHY